MVLAALGLIAMALVLTFAFVKGDFTGEGSTLLSMPWGIVSLVDLYVGFALFSGWIAYREAAWPRAGLDRTDDGARFLHRQPVCSARFAEQQRLLASLLDGQSRSRRA